MTEGSEQRIERRRWPTPPGFRQSRAWLTGIRTGFLTVVALSILPIVILASALAARQADAAQSTGAFAVWITASVMPVLLGFAGCLAISLATEAWILRWVRFFESMAQTYALGRYGVRPLGAQDAPAEFRALGEAVDNMAGAVKARDQALREGLEQQTMLLREVHHRVKNNLQVVTSLLGMQAARADDGNVKEALLQALLRLDAISITERYTIDEEQTGAAATQGLFDDWAGQVRARATRTGAGVALVAEVQNCALPMALASPLVMIATEGFLRARALNAGGPTRLSVRVACDGETARLRIETPDRFDDDGSIACSLIRGFVRQIHGEMFEAVDGGAFEVAAPLLRGEPASPSRVTKPSSTTQHPPDQTPGAAPEEMITCPGTPPTESRPSEASPPWILNASAKSPARAAPASPTKSAASPRTAI